MILADPPFKITALALHLSSNWWWCCWWPVQGGLHSWSGWLCPTFARAVHTTAHNGRECDADTHGTPRHTFTEQQQQQRDTTQSALDQRPVQTHVCPLLILKWGSWEVLDCCQTGAMKRPTVSLRPIPPFELDVKAKMLAWGFFCSKFTKSILCVTNSEENLSGCDSAMQPLRLGRVSPILPLRNGGRPLYSMVSTEVPLLRRCNSKSPCLWMAILCPLQSLSFALLGNQAV